MTAGKSSAGDRWAYRVTLAGFGPYGDHYTLLNGLSKFGLAMSIQLKTAPMTRQSGLSPEETRTDREHWLRA
ncbi:MAG: hypothetical protein ACREL7_10670 [Longimicrobiales bacterium]